MIEKGFNFWGIEICNGNSCNIKEYQNRYRNLDTDQIDCEPNVSDYYFETLKLRIIQFNRNQLDSKVVSFIKQINKLQNYILDAEFSLNKDNSSGEYILKESHKIAEKAALFLNLYVGR